MVLALKSGGPLWRQYVPNLTGEPSVPRGKRPAANYRGATEPSRLVRRLQLLGHMTSALSLLARPVLAGAAVGFTALSLAAPLQKPSAGACTPVAEVSRLRELPEGSGLAVSRRNPRVLWAVNDSERPIVWALDEGGRAIGRITVTGATVYDWEDLSVGPCPGGSCLYVADIGDNKADRPYVVLYRMPEPSLAAATDPAESARFTYPEGPQDAEALFIGPTGQLEIITKGDTGPIVRYSAPGFRSGTTTRLTRVGPLETSGRTATDKEPRVTDAEASPDGRWVAVRTHHAVIFYGTADLFSAASPSGSAPTSGSLASRRATA
jgi:hypothetical protein